MKNYGKKTYKTFQIRLTEEENAELINFIEKFGTTRREFILKLIRNYENS
jgi:hypothetical protein